MAAGALCVTAKATSTATSTEVLTSTANSPGTSTASTATSGMKADGKMQMHPVDVRGKKRVPLQALCENALPEMFDHQLASKPLDVLPLNALPMDSVTDSDVQSDMTAKGTNKRVHSQMGSGSTSRQTMQWTAPLSLFVLNRVVQLVEQGIQFDKCFKDLYIRKVSDAVLEFTGLTITSTQVYNHLRKWRVRWVRINELKRMPGVVWYETSTTLMMADVQLLHHLQTFPRDEELLNHPITNFAQMKAIFKVRTIQPRSMYAPALIIKAMDFLADNAEEQLKYSSMSKPERCAWLRAYLRSLFVDAFPDDQ